MFVEFKHLIKIMSVEIFLNKRKEEDDTSIKKIDIKDLVEVIFTFIRTFWYPL